MSDTIKPEMKIFAAPLEQGDVPPLVSTVERMDGPNFIKLKRTNTFDGQAHWIPTDWVAKVDSTGVYLNRTQADFHRGKLFATPVRL